MFRNPFESYRLNIVDRRAEPLTSAMLRSGLKTIRRSCARTRRPNRIAAAPQQFR